MKTKYNRVFKWFYPGIGIKRWIGLSTFGVILLVLGTAHLRNEEYWLIRLLDAVIVLSGIIILILGIKRMMRSFILAFVPSSTPEIIGYISLRFPWTEALRMALNCNLNISGRARQNRIARHPKKGCMSRGMANCDKNLSPPKSRVRIITG